MNRPFRCSVAGCPGEIAVCVGAECRCFAHALQRLNEVRRERGLAPLVLADDGSLQPEH